MGAEGGDAMASSAYVYSSLTLSPTPFQYLQVIFALLGSCDFGELSRCYSTGETYLPRYVSWVREMPLASLEQVAARVPR